MLVRLCAIVLALHPSVLGAAPVRLLVIGDSMSEEYANELPFSAPDSSPFQANTMNWVEILDALRPDAIDFGASGVYLDLRGIGFSYNWGFPGATAPFWRSVLSSTLFQNPGYLPSRTNLLAQLETVDAAVVFLGGNDVNGNYDAYYDDQPSEAFETATLEALEFILETLRSRRPDLPLLLVDAPDVGATPLVREAYPDPARRAAATARIGALNDRVHSLAASHGAGIIRLFALTRAIEDSPDYAIGPVPMIPSADRENRPNFMFCKERFHPASGLSAKIADAILGGVNEVLGEAIAPLRDDEIVGEILGLRAYLDWIENYPAAPADLDADHDGDGWVNLAEFALARNPLIHDPAPAAYVREGALELALAIPASVPGIVEATWETSFDLQVWQPLDPARAGASASDRPVISFGPTAPPYLRMRFRLAP